MKESHSPFINSIDYFRGIAILIIIAGHSYGLAGWKIDTFSEKVIANILTGGTGLFVFISGFLFQHIYLRRFNYGHFLKKKLLTVVVPYVIFTILGVAYFVWYLHTSPRMGDGFITLGWWGGYVKPLLLYLWSGAIFPPYWFVPFMFFTFLMSPLHVRFAHLNRFVQLMIIGITLIIAVSIHRPGRMYCHFQAVIYFLPVYLTGIFSSLHRETIYKVFKNKEWILVAGVLLSAITHVYLYGTYDNLTKCNPYIYTCLDIALIQKLFLSLFFMVFLHRFEDAKWGILKIIASASFALFFLHPLVTHFYGPHGRFDLPPLLLLPYKVGVVVAICIVIGLIIKKIFGTCSRYLIGW